MSDLLDHPTKVRPGEELDLGRLKAYLRYHFPDQAATLDVRQFPSGHSNLTYALKLGAQELVLRRPPFGSKVKSAHDMSREFRVLAKLHAFYPAAPEVLIFCDDDSILGAPFYIMQPIHGIILRKHLPPELQLSPEKARRLDESLIDKLICLHQVDYVAAGLAELGKPGGYLARQVRGWIERYHGSKTHDYPEVEEISRWLEQNLPATQSAALIHNDYKFDNVILEAGDITKIAGVLDWEMCTIGDPLADLGTTLAYWADPSDPDELRENLSEVTTLEGSLTRSQMAEHYARKTGCDISHMAFYLALARFKLAVIVQQIFYRYHQGLTRDPRFAALPARIAALFRASLSAARGRAI